MKTKHVIGKLAVLALAIGLILPGVAQAYPKQGWYLGVGAGANFLQDNDAKIGATTNRIESSPGFLLDSAIGFGFESQLRPEFEIAYRRNTVDKTSGTGSGVARGNMNSVAFMGNLFYDFQTQTGLTPYLGVGVGGALVGADDAGIVFSSTFDNQPFLFAYQGIAGFSYELSERWDITADYRYFATLDPDYKTRTGLVTSEPYLPCRFALCVWRRTRSTSARCHAHPAPSGTGCASAASDDDAAAADDDAAAGNATAARCA